MCNVDSNYIEKHQDLIDISIQKLRIRAEDLYLQQHQNAMNYFHQLSNQEDTFDEEVWKHCNKIKKYYDDQNDFIYRQAVRDTIKILAELQVL